MRKFSENKKMKDEIKYKRKEVRFNQGVKIKKEYMEEGKQRKGRKMKKKGKRILRREVSMK